MDFETKFLIGIGAFIVLTIGGFIWAAFRDEERADRCSARHCDHGMPMYLKNACYCVEGPR